jgi:hypothetical protein
MATHQPSNHSAPEFISFLVLLNELQRRAVHTQGAHPERELLFEELVEKEHSLEQRILRQLELSYSENQCWWRRLLNLCKLRMNEFASTFKPRELLRFEADSPERQR